MMLSRTTQRNTACFPSSSCFSDMSSVLIDSNRDVQHHLHRFHRTFGIMPRQVSLLWDEVMMSRSIRLLSVAEIKRLRPIHLLWALMFLKCYAIEQRNASSANCSEKTFRKWSWYYIGCIASLSTKYVCKLFAKYILRLKCDGLFLYNLFISITIAH